MLIPNKVVCIYKGQQQVTKLYKLSSDKEFMGFSHALHTTYAIFLSTQINLPCKIALPHKIQQIYMYTEVYTQTQRNKYCKTSCTRLLYKHHSLFCMFDKKVYALRIDSEQTYLSQEKFFDIWNICGIKPPWNSYTKLKMNNKSILN